MIYFSEHGAGAATPPVITAGLWFLLTIRITPPSRRPVSRKEWVTNPSKQALGPDELTPCQTTHTAPRTGPQHCTAPTGAEPPFGLRARFTLSKCASFGPRLSVSIYAAKVTQAHDRAHQAGPPRAERAGGADASDAEEGGHETRGANVLQQQARFDGSSSSYNRDRPHQALNMKYPADRYTPSPRSYRGLEELAYPFHDGTVVVTHCGRICLEGAQDQFSRVICGSEGRDPPSGRAHLARHLHAFHLCYFRRRSRRLEPVENPFVQRCYLCPRNGPRAIGGGGCGWPD